VTAGAAPHGSSRSGRRTTRATCWIDPLLLLLRVAAAVVAVGAVRRTSTWRSKNNIALYSNTSQSTATKSQQKRILGGSIGWIGSRAEQKETKNAKLAFVVPIISLPRNVTIEK
jgi:hypothetical protein